jgi:hypothetical protein
MAYCSYWIGIQHSCRLRHYFKFSALLSKIEFDFTFQETALQHALNVPVTAVRTDSANILFKYCSLKTKTNERILCIIQFVRHREHSLLPLEQRIAKCSRLKEYNNCWLCRTSRERRLNESLWQTLEILVLNLLVYAGLLTSPADKPVEK